MTDEPLELVEPWAKKVGATHPIVILPGKELEKVIGVSGFPTSAVFLDKEKVWKGHPSGASGPLADAHKKARKDSIYPKKLSKVIKSLDKGQKVKALADLQALMLKLEGEDLAWAGRLEAYLLDKSAKDFAESEELIAKGYWHKGVSLAKPYLGKGSTYPMAEEKVARLAELEKDPLYKKEMAGGELYAEGQKLESEQEYSDAFKAYKAAMKKGSGSQIATHAHDAAAKLIEDRRPGYKPSCQTCKRNKGSACSKHLEKVKL
ncbi:MAG: hypothetical protein ACPG31_12980 [Planctomycetota bacterium]